MSVSSMPFCFSDLFSPLNRIDPRLGLSIPCKDGYPKVSKSCPQVVGGAE